MNPLHKLRPAPEPDNLLVSPRPSPKKRPSGHRQKQWAETGTATCTCCGYVGDKFAVIERVGPPSPSSWCLLCTSRKSAETRGYVPRTKISEASATILTNATFSDAIQLRALELDVPPEDLKECATCKKIKPENETYFDRRRGEGSGYTESCSLCREP